jgi:hypothetical protein
MRYTSIKGHLRPYIMLARRRTTINHAFAAAVAPNDSFKDAQVRKAILVLGQDPDGDLLCVYCGSDAETWDHVFATVHQSTFSGAGHRIGNLLPCCKPCNSAKGNKHWNVYLSGLSLGSDVFQERHARISGYLEKYLVQDRVPSGSPEFERLDSIRRQILMLLGEADDVAKHIRAKAG